jgi:hypothetical protein
LGLCALGKGRAVDAVPLLERALALREVNRMPPVRQAEVRYPLARAVFEAGGDAARAVALARQALVEYRQAAATPVVARDLVELERWLQTHAPTPAPA